MASLYARWDKNWIWGILKRKNKNVSHCISLSVMLSVCVFLQEVIMMPEAWPPLDQGKNERWRPWLPLDFPPIIFVTPDGSLICWPVIGPYPVIGIMVDYKKTVLRHGGMNDSGTPWRLIKNWVIPWRFIWTVSGPGGLLKVRMRIVELIAVSGVQEWWSRNKTWFVSNLLFCHVYLVQGPSCWKGLCGTFSFPTKVGQYWSWRGRWPSHPHTSHNCGMVFNIEAGSVQTDWL